MSNGAAKDMGTVVERLLAGWPVYGVVFVFLAGYSELYIEKKISDGIKEETGQTETVHDIETAVALNTDAVDDLSDDVVALTASINTLNSDVKETLRILAAR
jgi:hypothetical protein